MTVQVQKPEKRVETVVRIPRGVPLYGFFGLPRGRLLKVCAEPCAFAPGYIQSNKPRWPSGAKGDDLA